MKRSMCIIIMGPPGAGKGTQAIRVSEALGFPLISMGALIRTLFNRETDFDAQGLRIAFGDGYKEIIASAAKKAIEELKTRGLSWGELTIDEIHKMHDSGKLLPDEFIMTFLKAALTQITNKVSKGILLDGVPRTVEQAKMLYPVLEAVGIRELKVIFLDVPREVCFDRIVKRAQEQPTRADQESFGVRWKEYEEKTVPLLRYYESMGVLRKVDGVGAIEEITRRILDVLS
ncbi:MAG: nucleoside monophosphate kinase [Crenarchaeota archaeon]|nr:nucleoside monophosphate kinase [Thermoproteota archaeon]